MDTLKKFSEIAENKKQNSFIVKGVLLVCLVVSVSCILFAWCSTKIAYDNIVVVERSGEYLKTTAEERENLFVSLVQTTCAQLSKYANSFSRQDINDNQTKALFLCNKDELAQVFLLYKNEGAYHEAIERGVVYSCELEKVDFIGDKSPYLVKFSSILSVYDNRDVFKYRIVSEGEIVKIRPDFPNNVTGLFFTKYKQTLRVIE